MAHTEAVIMDEGEPFIHMQTLIATLQDNLSRSPAHVAPGVETVIHFLTMQHDSIVLSDRQD